MDKIFNTYKKFTDLFFNDILVFLANKEEHNKHLSRAFEELCKHKLFVNAKKSDFFSQATHYLGHNQVRIDPEKIKALCQKLVRHS